MKTQILSLILMLSISFAVQAQTAPVATAKEAKKETVKTEKQTSESAVKAVDPPAKGKAAKKKSAHADHKHKKGDDKSCCSSKAEGEKKAGCGSESGAKPACCSSKNKSTSEAEKTK